MSDATQADTGAQEGGSEATDTNPVLDRVEQLAGDLGSLGESVQSILGRLPEPQAEAEQETDDPWSHLFDEPEQEAEQAPALNVEALRQAFRAELEQELSVRDQEIAHLRTTHDLQSLLEKHPDLKDPEVRRETGTRAREIAEQMFGAEHASVLTNNPDFIALVHQAQAGQRAAAAEVAADSDTTQLEGGGGVAPGGVEQPSIVARVMQNRRSIPKGFR